MVAPIRIKKIMAEVRMVALNASMAPPQVRRPRATPITAERNAPMAPTSLLLTTPPRSQRVAERSGGGAPVDRHRGVGENEDFGGPPDPDRPGGQLVRVAMAS